MGLLDFLRSLFQIGERPKLPGGRYVDSRRKTKTGRLRARPAQDDSRGRYGIDRGIYGIATLSQSARKVYVYLSATADEDGCCFPFIKTIARRTKLSKSTVSKAIKELEEADLINRRQRVSRRGQSSNLYYVKKVSETRWDLPAGGDQTAEPQGG